MHLSKRQSLILSVVLIGGFLLSAALYSRWSQLEPEADFDSVSAAVEDWQDDPAPAVMRQFHRSETKDGQLLWEIRADSGRLQPESSTILIENAQVSYYRKRDEPLLLQAAQAVLHLREGSVIRADLSGGVKLEAERDTIMRTKSAVYDQESESISGREKVQISNPSAVISGWGFHVDLEKEELQLLQKVSSVIHPRAAKLD